MATGCACRKAGEMVVLACGNAAEVAAILEEVLARLPESIEKHGDWADYDAEQVFDAVAEEFDEYREAFVAQRLNGEHGQIDELYDLAVTVIKGIRRLTG